MEEDKKKAKGKGLSLTGTLKLDRRKFLKSLTLVGTGVMAYSSPAISAVKSLAAEVKTLSPITRAIDLQLPATYKISEPTNWLEIQLGKDKVKANFSANGKVVLNKTKDPNIAEVKVISLTYKSVEKEPLANVGYKTGTITAYIPQDTRLGTFNLKTGQFNQDTLPIKISLSSSKAINSGSNPAQTLPIIADGDRKCTIDGNQVQVPITKTATKGETVMPAHSVVGRLNFNFIPEAVQR